MNINKKTESMRRGGKLLAQLLTETSQMVRPHMSGARLNEFVEKRITELNAVAAFKHYQGFPAALCVSVNDEVVHGIPSAYQFKVGDIVGLDLGIRYEGFYTDSAITVIVTETGCKTVHDVIKNAQTEPEKLLVNTYKAMQKGIEQVRDGAHVGDIGHAIQQHAESAGYGVVRQLVGHGVGNAVHEEPSVPNFGKPHTGLQLKTGQTIAIEPMVTAGGWKVLTDPDGWTIRTEDGSLAAHFEHTVLVTDTGYEILT